MLSEIFIVGFGVIGAEMDAACFLPAAGAVGDESADGKHVLTLPALGGVQDLVHDVAAPDVDEFDGFVQAVAAAFDADVAPH